MFLDILFNILFFVLVAYLLFNIFFDMSNFEWSAIKWFKRVFGICKHNNTKLYSVAKYISSADGPKVIYRVMCGNCNKKIGQYTVPVANILDLNLKTAKTDEWCVLTEEEFAVIRTHPHHDGRFYL